MTATAELTLTPEQEHDSAVELVAALEERVREGDASTPSVCCLSRYSVPSSRP